MKSDNDHLRLLLTGMRNAFARGENVMAYARQVLTRADNDPVATLVAYDLQSGSYIAAVRQNPGSNARWCRQLAELVTRVLPVPTDFSDSLHGGTILEVGCGEATTLAGVVKAMEKDHVRAAYGFDLSWSRVAEGRGWLSANGANASLFVGDLFHIPLAEGCIDVVYSSHSLEPNRGREIAAIRECLRVAQHAVVLVEPIYELASHEARRRMDEHGYVRGLKAAAEDLGAEVLDYRLLADDCPNPLNPSGVVLLGKRGNEGKKPESLQWICPLTGAPLYDHGDFWFAAEVGIAYPVLRGIPMLRPEHAIVASGLEGKSNSFDHSV
jgi:SAM-dependent methyltransferase